jgi:8-oxo-dGTP pyrophosphatase MutT (NUDIX family)
MPAKELQPFRQYVAGLNKKRMAAGILFRDVDGKVLLVKPWYKDGWDIPGGAVNANESPWDCAARELTEELGLDHTIDRVLVVDYVSERGAMPEGIAFVFDGGILDSSARESMRFVDGEIVAADFYALPDIRSKVISRLADRVAAALTALERQVTLMCVDGTPVGP